jgi:hypothetical protein
MAGLGQEFEFAAVRSGGAGSVRPKDTCGPFLPFGHATDFAVAADQSGRPCEAQHFPAMDGRSVPTTGIVRSEKVSLIGVEATFGQGPIFWLFEISKA